MAEHGAQPTVPRGRRLFLRAVRHLFSPLRPDDYLEMINPLWTTKELRGKVERVEPQGSEAASVLIRPGYEWVGHKPGQYVRLGLVINGRYHWRAYSLTSDPAPDDGLISVTPKKVDSGVVSPYLVERIQPGEVVRLGEVEGVFTLPEPLPPKMLFISAGSGITPIISMLRSLDRRNELGDVVVIHSVSKRDQVMFGSVLEDLDGRHEHMRLDLRLTSERGRMSPSDLDELCPANCWMHSSSTGNTTATPIACTSSVSSRRSGAMGVQAWEAKCPSSKARQLLNVTATRRFWKPARKPALTWRTAAESASATPVSGH
jgi:ferredoxin-NADP reductase